MSKPFYGLSFCCTGVNSTDRQVLADQVATLGGTFHVDLMSLVRYLVVGKRDTEKYKFSVRYRHDVTFLGTHAVSEFYKRWRAGQDVVVSRDLEKLPIFSGYQVCLARITRPSEDEARKLMTERFRQPPTQSMPKIMPEDPFLEAALSKVLSKLGASVSTTLTQNCSLVVATNASGKRHTMAKEWNKPIVHPIWIFDSCLREAAMNLEDYEISTGFNTYNSTSFVWKKLYLSRIASLDVNPLLDRQRERLPLRKNPEIWTSIMDSAHPLLTKEVTTDTWSESTYSELDSKESDIVEEKNSILSSQEQPSTLFQGLSFLPIGLTILEQNILKSVVESHKGKVVTYSEDESITHVIMLVKNGPQTQLMLLMLPSSVKRRLNEKGIKLVTNWFIERSIFYNKICDDMWARPMMGIVPLKIKRKVCMTGFTGVELLHLEKLVSYLNLEFCETLNSSRDMLVVNINLFKDALSKSSPKLFEYRMKDVINCPVYASRSSSKSVATLSSKNKMTAARKWGIPIVSAAFLWEMVASLEGQANLMVPEVSDAQWCIYVPPKDSKTKSGFIVAKEVARNTLPRAELMNSSYSSVKLPSPRKTKDREKYGRLVGRGESLLKKLEAARDRNVDESRDPPSEGASSQDASTVGYGNDEKAEKQKILLEKLEGTAERQTKRPRRVQPVEYLK